MKECVLLVQYSIFEISNTLIIPKTFIFYLPLPSYLKSFSGKKTFSVSNIFPFPWLLTDIFLRLLIYLSVNCISISHSVAYWLYVVFVYFFFVQFLFFIWQFSLERDIFLVVWNILSSVFLSCWLLVCSVSFSVYHYRVPILSVFKAWTLYPFLFRDLSFIL